MASKSFSAPEGYQNILEFYNSEGIVTKDIIFEQLIIYNQDAELAEWILRSEDEFIGNILKKGTIVFLLDLIEQYCKLAGHINRVKNIFNILFTSNGEFHDYIMKSTNISISENAIFYMDYISCYLIESIKNCQNIEIIELIINTFSEWKDYIKNNSERFIREACRSRNLEGLKKFLDLLEFSSEQREKIMRTYDSYF